MNIPYKQMFEWKTANFAPTILGLWYLIVPFLAGAKVINQTMAFFGLTFLSISIVNARNKPTVLASLFTALIGIAYLLGTMTTISDAILWTMGILLFAGVVIFEFDIFSIGPKIANAKVLTIVPLTLLGFATILGLAGYNPYITFDFAKKMLVSLNYLAVMVFCWIYVFDYAGYRPLGRNTNTYLNIMAIAAVLLSLVGVYQGTLFQW